MVIDTLTIAREIETAGADKQVAEAIAHGIAQGGDDERLREVERRTAGVETRLAILTGMTGALVAVMLATLWQMFALRGEITALSAAVARIEARAP